MKIFGQVVSVQPLALIVSLPNQLFAHVPITQISSQLTSLLEAMDENEESPSSEDEEEDVLKSRVPDLFRIFHPGQYVRAVVTAVHLPGATDVAGLGRARDEVQKASRRVELSLIPEKVNAGVVKADLRAGFVCLLLLFFIIILTFNSPGNVCSCKEYRGPRLHSRSRIARCVWFLVLQGHEEMQL